MFAYCNNNPITLSDSNGHFPCTSDPSLEIAWQALKWAYNKVKEMTKEDISNIENGTVKYVSNGKNTGAKIINSYKIQTPWVMCDFINTNRSDDIAGTTQGAVYEWMFHNVAYKLGDWFGLDSIKESAEHTEVGKTIFADKREGINAKSVMSFGMKISYVFTHPLQAIKDMRAQNKE